MLVIAKMLVTRKQFEGEIAKHAGVTWDHDAEDSGQLILDSPKGKIFKANGAHCLVEQFSNTGGQSWKPEAYANMIERLSMGLEECSIEDCDSCEAE